MDIILFVIVVLWILNTLSTAATIALGRDFGTSFLVAFLKGLVLAQFPGVSQIKIAEAVKTFHSRRMIHKDYL